MRQMVIYLNILKGEIYVMYSGKAYCAKHLLGRIDKDRYGNWYRQCTYGHHLFEKCDLRKANGEPLFSRGGENDKSSDNQ